MLLHDSLQGFASYAVPIVTIVEAICASTIIYLALYHSKNMTRYRFLLINTVLWSCLFNLLTCFCKPALMLPSACILFYNSYFHDAKTTNFVLQILIFLYVNVQLSVFWSFLYRYFMAYPGWISNTVEHGRAPLFVMYGGQLLLYVVMLAPAFFYGVPDPALEDEAIRQQIPQLYGTKLLTEIGWHCEPHPAPARKFALVGFILNVMFFFIGLIFYSVLFKRVLVSKPAGVAARNTHRMHLMLFKAVSAQLFIASSMLLLPSATILLAYYTEWEEGTTLSSGCIFLIQLHGCFDFIAMICFITPYRRKLQQIFMKSPKVGSQYRNYRTNSVNEPEKRGGLNAIANFPIYRK